jgi:preprotein translocase subunit YajC
VAAAGAAEGFPQALQGRLRLDSLRRGRNYNAAPHSARPAASIAARTITTRTFDVFISNAYAQSAAPASGASSLMQFLPLVLMFVVLYFIMIRPQMKRQKEHRAMIDALAKGDEVVVGGGVIGRVAKMGDSVLHIEVAKDVEIQVQRSAVVQVLPKGTYK